MKNLKYKHVWLVVGYSLVALVVYLSLTSSSVEMGELFPYEDKVYHALAYFTLMAWFGQIYHQPLKRNLFAIAFVLLGLSMEFLQSFDPARMAEFADMLANTVGVLLGIALSLTRAKNILANIESRLFS